MPPSSKLTISYGKSTICWCAQLETWIYRGFPMWFSTFFFAANRGPPSTGRWDSHGRLDITKEPIHHLHSGLQGMRIKSGAFSNWGGTVKGSFTLSTYILYIYIYIFIMKQDEHTIKTYTYIYISYIYISYIYIYHIYIYHIYNYIYIERVQT